MLNSLKLAAAACSVSLIPTLLFMIYQSRTTMRRIQASLPTSIFITDTKKMYKHGGVLGRLAQLNILGLAILMQGTLAKKGMISSSEFDQIPKRVKIYILLPQLISWALILIMLIAYINHTLAD